MSTYQVIYEFSGRASQEAMDVAAAVAELVGPGDFDGDGDVRISAELAARAAEHLGDGWTARAVLAVLENCAFSARKSD